MNGPEHYFEAELCLAAAETTDDPAWAQAHIALGQLHATLALVQATIDAAPSAHSLTEWGKRNADARPMIEEEAAPEPVLHTAGVSERTVPVAGTDTVRTVWEASCSCGYKVPGTFADKEVALLTLRAQHPEVQA